MNNPVATQNNSYIDITDLSDFLRNNGRRWVNLDGHYMQVIEEVSFLCVNDNFIRDIIDTRKRLLKSHPGLNIPTDNTRQAESILGYVYEHSYKLYKNLIAKLIDKYKLLPSLYWKDKFYFLASEIETRLGSTIFPGEKLSKSEARNEAIESIIEDMDLELLDSLILRNKPFDMHDGLPFWANPGLTRKTIGRGDISMNLKKTGRPRLEIGFPPYATLPDMQAILKDNYKMIQEYREANLPVLSKRDHRKDNLPKMIDAYMLHTQGKSLKSIANILDKRYGDYNLYEGVSQMISRIKSESKRFNH